MASVGAALSISVKLLNEAKADLARLQKDLDGVGDEAKKASPKLNDASDKVTKISKVAGAGHGPLGKFGGALGDVAKIAGGFIIAQGLIKLPGLLSSFVGGASSLSESLSKVRIVFGESAAEIEDWAATAAKALGMSKGAALEAAGTFGNFLQAMGATTPEATKMSKSMVQLATDLGSFNNADPTEVLLALRSGLSGEAEPLRKFGVALSEAAVKAKLLELGIKPLGKEFTEQQKIQARYAIIMEQTSMAQGDFARTSGGLANQTKILQASFKDAADQLGTALLPGIVAVAGALIQVLPTVIAVGEALGGKVMSAAQAAWGVVAPLIVTVAGLAWDGLKLIGDITWSALTDAWSVVAPLLAKVAGLAWDGLVKVGEGSWEKMVAAWTVISDRMGSVPWGKIKDGATDTNNWAAAWEAVAKKMQPAVDLLKPLVEKILVSLKTQFDEVKEALGPLLDAFKEWEPILKPLAIVIGTVLVVAVAAILVALDLWVKFVTATVIPMIETLTKIVRGITASFEFVTGKVKAWGPEIGAAFLVVWNVFKANAALIIGIFAELVTDMKQKGKDIVTGLWEGIESLDEWLRAKVFAFGQKIFNAVKAGLGKLNPFSPSKYGIEVGYFLGKGIEVGISQMLPSLLSTVNSMGMVVSTALAAAMRFTVGGVGSGPGGFGTGPGGSQTVGMTSDQLLEHLYTQLLGGQIPGSPTNGMSLGAWGALIWDQIQSMGSALNPLDPFGGTLPGATGPDRVGIGQIDRPPLRPPGAPQPIILQIDGREIAYALANHNARSFA